MNFETASEPSRIDWALNEFRVFDGKYKKDAMNFALEHREEMIPRLLSILEGVLSDPEAFLPPEHEHDEDGECLEHEGENIWSHIYAVTLLSHFRESRAHSLIAKIFALPEQIVDQLFGDMITEDLPALLYSTYPGSPEAIQALALNRKADDFCRSSAAKALTYCVAGGLLDRDSVVEFLGGLFTGSEAEGHSDFWSLVAGDLIDLRPLEKMPVIRKAYEQGLISEGMISQETFDEEIEIFTLEESLEKLRREMKRYLPDNVHERLERWAAFREPERRPQRSYRDDFTEIPYIRETPKVGRNEPCPCGSGKKYKKCCAP